MVTKPMATEIAWELIVQNKKGRITNMFFQTLRDAEGMLRQYQSIDWNGDVYRREIDYDDNYLY